MQRFFLYCFFAMALVLESMAVKADTPKDALQIDIPADRITHTNSQPLLLDQSFSSDPIFARLVRQIQGSRIPTFCSKTANNGSRLLKLHHFTQTINQKMIIAGEVYTTHYSHKQQNGHYLFALRKLRI